MRPEGVYSGYNRQVGGGAVLILFGLLWTLLAGFVFASCLSIASRVAGSSFACLGPGAFVAIGVALVIFGIVALLVGPRQRPLTTYNPAVPPPIVQPVVIQQTLREETVKVRCRYCGTLSDVTATICPSCGAHL